MKKCKKTIVELVLFWLPYAIILAMLIHCGTVAIIDLVRQSGVEFPSTSFPWWARAALISFAYLFFSAISFLIWFIYRKITSKNK